MKKGLVPVLALLLLLCACGKTADESTREENTEKICFTDDLGRTVTLEGKPSRVAALIGSFADVWCLAGGEDALVAAAEDAWTSFDLALGEEVISLGAVKEPNLELLLAARPDFVIGSCNTGADLALEETLAGAGIPVAYFDVNEFEDYLNMLRICTELTGKEENYEIYGERVCAQVERAKELADGSAPRVLYIRATGVSCKVKGSRGTVLGSMLAALGCVNIADSGKSLLEELSLEAIIEGDPDYIFAVLQGATPERAQKQLEDTLLSNPAWQSLRAVREGRFFVLDNALYNLKPNDQWGRAYEELAALLYEN